MSDPVVIVYTDGACEPNPGPGGWAAILRYTDSDNRVHTKELSGNEEKSTNNRMEIMGVLEALRALKFPCHVRVFSDSQYVVKAVGHWHKGEPRPSKQGWIVDWQKNGWRRRRGPLKNKKLWQQLLREVQQQLTFKITWVKGHDGNQLNEQADFLAVEARLKLGAMSDFDATDTA